MKDIYYIVELSDEAMWDIRGLTTITPRFYGKLINTSCGNFYFELYGYPDSIVIIPHSWIGLMAPSKRLNPFFKKYKDLSIEIDANQKKTDSKEGDNFMEV